MIITGKKFSKPEMSRVINGDIVLENNDEQEEKFRLDMLLVEKYPEYNRATLQRFIKDGRVTVDGKLAKKSNEKYAKTAEIILDKPANELVMPELPVIYEDEHVLVVNKPAGLLSMAKGEYTEEVTLENYGLLVHRLDRDTCGVVILAKDEETQTMLRKQFQDRKAHKTYYAVVSGRPKMDEALIDLPMARNLKRPTTFQVDANGKSAQTHYKVVDTDDKHSLVELKPTTGRTHQLRVHLKYIGTPILGDAVYGEEKADRLYLHATELEITIPKGERKTFAAPLPAEFKNVLR